MVGTLLKSKFPDNQPRTNLGSKQIFLSTKSTWACSVNPPASLSPTVTQKGSCKQSGKRKPDYGGEPLFSYIFLEAFSPVVVMLPFPYTGRYVPAISFLLHLLKDTLRGHMKVVKPQRESMELNDGFCLPKPLLPISPGNKVVTEQHVDGRVTKVLPLEPEEKWCFF